MNYKENIHKINKTETKNSNNRKKHSKIEQFYLVSAFNVEKQENNNKKLNDIYYNNDGNEND